MRKDSFAAYAPNAALVVDEIDQDNLILEIFHAVYN